MNDKDMKLLKKSIEFSPMLIPKQFKVYCKHIRETRDKCEKEKPKIEFPQYFKEGYDEGVKDERNRIRENILNANHYFTVEVIQGHKEGDFGGHRTWIKVGDVLEVLDKEKRT